MLKSAVELCRYHRYSNLLVHMICRSIRFETKLKLSKMQKVTNNETRNPRHTLDEFITFTTSSDKTEVKKLIYQYHIH